MYIPLRVQSSFSMLESTIEIKGLAKTCAERGIPAVGLTDKGNLFGAMAFSMACLDNGVQPVVGVMLPVVRDMPPGSLRPGTKPPIDHLVLYARNETGWNNLLQLVSDSHLKGEAPLAGLEGRTEGLLCLTGGADGALARLCADGQLDEAQNLLNRLKALFGDALYIEISRTNDPVEKGSELHLLRMAHADNVPIVATNPARFIQPDGHAAHDVMLCISEGAYLETKDRKRSNPNHYLLHEKEMQAKFHDLPEALEMTEVVAMRTAFSVKKRDPVLPKLVPDAEAEKKALNDLAAQGLRERFAAVPVADEAPYWERLNFELDIIAQMGFPGYFLIVADFIQWAKDQNIPVGPGRGSGAGSAVAWALKITDLDPLALGLLFERFLNPERKSMPDFDIDFCETRRMEVILYVQQKYGREQVAQIITFGTLKARAVVKDVGRVMQMSYGQVNRIAGLIPANPADPWDLKRAIEGVPELRAEMKSDPQVKHLIEIGLQLENRPRHSSTHAAGVVIGDRPLSELVPLYRDPRSDFPVTQFDLKWAEAAGLVKFDFLGLKTLSVLERARQLLEKRGIHIDLAKLPMDDPGVYEMMTRGDTVGVFQFESEGMRRALALVKPTVFEDIIALAALYRPGPMDNIPSFAARKWGREEPDYLHPMLEPLLKPTYGVIIYQEQVMQIAQVMASYSLGEADLLRRAMGKKIKAEMDAQRARFVEGAVKNGVDAEQAEFIFNLVDKFAGYGFNKSHAAAYALVALQTAWIKHHHPAAFYAASMAYDIHMTDKLAVFVDDMRRLDVPLLGPCINKSGADFTLEDFEGRVAVRYALGALKGVGEAAMEDIVRERDAKGPFKSIDDFVNRIDPKAVNRRQMEALAAAGAFDCFGLDRAQVHKGADMLMGAATRAAEQRATGQGGLFASDSEAEAVPLPEVTPWPLGERLSIEKDAFGFWFSGHPVEAHASVLKAMAVETAVEVLARRAAPGTKSAAKMAGLVEGFRWRVPQGKGQDRRYMLADLTDQSGKWGASCFNAEAQGQIEAAVKEGEPLLLDVELQWREGDESPRLAIMSAMSLAELAKTTRALLTIKLEGPCNPKLLAALVAWLPRGGRSVVDVDVPVAAGGRAIVRLGHDFLLPAGVDIELSEMDGIAQAQVSAMNQGLRAVN